MEKQESRRPNVAFVGFGEAAAAFLTGWSTGRPDRVSAYDVKTDAAESKAAMLDRYAVHKVRGADTISAALDGVAVVFSMVTADQALDAAEAGASGLQQGALWLDCNSCAPGTKRRAAEVIEAAGGRYVDVAVMAPVHPRKHKVPLLVAGPHADEAHDVLTALEMCPSISGSEIGQASSIKMIRSIMIKGFEALTAECFLSARRAGVQEQVLASLEVSDPDVAWRKRGSYNLERMMLHGTRRASEMREVAATVAELGLDNGMSAAAAAWQDRIADLGVDPGEDDLFSRLDRVLSGL